MKEFVLYQGLKWLHLVDGLPHRVTAGQPRKVRGTNRLVEVLHVKFGTTTGACGYLGCNVAKPNPYLYLDLN